MRRTLCLLAALLALPLLGSDAPKEYDGATQPDELEGTWRLTEFAFEDRKQALDFQSVLTLRGRTYRRDDSDGDTFRGSYRTDLSHQPSHIDWMPSKGHFAGRTLKFIYQLDGDTLREAGFPDEDYARRPRGFKDNGVEVWTYKRVK
jgi:uncharacterized protein (TIGR03067 family)